MSLQPVVNASWDWETIFTHPLFAVSVGFMSFFAGLLVKVWRDRYLFKNQMRMAALSERLKAHQEAFNLIYGMTHDQSDPNGYWERCNTWWKENCLYLSGKIRYEFRLALIYYRDTQVYPTQKSSSEREVFRKIRKRTLRAITTSMGLPPIDDIEEMKKKSSDS